MKNIKRIKKPDALRGVARLRLLNGEIDGYLSLPSESRQKIRPPVDFSFFKDESLFDALHLMQGKCCAYCETPFQSEHDALITHYRPIQSVDYLQGTTRVEGYCWFAYEWKNIFLLCRDCEGYKLNFFPLGGTIAPLKSEWKFANEIELPILLDPCLDHPVDHLVFDLGGRAVGISDRGDETISHLNLNRPTLLQQRRLIFDNTINALLGEDREHLNDLLDDVNNQHSPYSGAVVIILRGLCKLLTGFGEHKIARSHNRLISLVKYCINRYDTNAWIDAIEKYRGYVLHSRSNNYFFQEVLQSRWNLHYSYIQTIEIIKFKNIENFTLSFDENLSSSFAPSMMLLGENGVGKSSILQALDLVLMPPKQRKRVGKGIIQPLVSPYDGNLERGEEIQAPIDIIVKYENGSSTRLHQDEYSGGFRRDGDPLSMSLSYGSRRYFVEGKGSSSEHTRNVTLFNPANFLQDPTIWLRNIDDQKFDAVARALRPILCLRGADHIFRDANKFIFGNIDGNTLPINKLSEGFKSIITMAVDMMRELLSEWDNLEFACGAVIIDEIENHLHPRWKMRVMRALRDAMPRVQFIVSTHDPLCLRGMKTGEVKVLYRNRDGQIRSVENLPDITALRVDQILTSDYFGLSSSEDPKQMELLEKIANYAAIPEDKLTPEERLGRDRALEEYGGIPYIGSSLDRHIIAEAITRHLRVESNLSVDQRISVREDSVEDILQVLQRAMQSYDIH